MKTLLEFLSIRKEDIYIGRFPATPKLDDVIEFLKNEGFTELIYTNKIHSAQEELTNEAPKSETPVFMYAKSLFEEYWWIRFCKQGKISTTNPIYCLFLTKDGTDLEKTGKKDQIGWIEYGDGKEGDDINGYDNFCKTVNKHFDWQ